MWPTLFLFALTIPLKKEEYNDLKPVELDMDFESAEPEVKFKVVEEAYFDEFDAANEEEEDERLSDLSLEDNLPFLVT
jgi:hypothetical protein